MKLYIHWLEMTGLINNDEIAFIADSLNIPLPILKTFKTSKGTNVYTFETSGESESVYISIPQEGYGRITLRGGYFDSFPHQSVQAFKNFMYSKNGNCLRLDVSLKDTSGHIDFNEYSRMSLLDNYLDYLAGSAVVCRKRKKHEVPDSTNRQGVPDLHTNHKLIHYGDSNSKQYVKLYQCPDGFNKFEVTLKDKRQTRILLDSYNTTDMTAFNELAKSALVKTLNFLTPKSKRAKRPVQIESYRKFLGNEVKPVKWTEHSMQKIELTKLETFVRWKNKIIGQLWKGIARFDLPRHDTERLFQEIEDRLIIPGVVPHILPCSTVPCSTQ